MNILRKVLRGFSVLAGVIALAAIFGFAFGVYYFNTAGLMNVSAFCVNMMLVAMAAVAVARMAWICLAPTPRPLSPAPFCHVGEPL